MVTPTANQFSFKDHAVLTNLRERQSMDMLEYTLSEKIHLKI